MTYATIGKRAQRVSQLAFLRLLAARPGVPARGADAVGRRLQDGGRAGRARRSRACRARITGSGSRVPTAGRGAVEIETTRPELIPACVALVAHPDDERYQPLFGTRRDRRRSSACACRCRPHHAGRSRKGQRHRDDLHVRRPHRRHLVARAEPAGARGHPAGRHAAAGDVGRAGLGIGGRRRARSGCYDQLARPVGGEGAARRSSSSCASPAISSASRARSRTP